MREWIIVGLGNHGEKYRRTRHNIGFMAISALCESWQIECNVKMYHSLIGEGTWRTHSVLLVQPQTYMNASGEAMRELTQARKVSLGNLLVICDDLALPLGKVRLRSHGSSGGNKGLESIIEELRTDHFPRLRIGIGPFPAKEDATQFVLERFSKGELEKVKQALERISWICETWLEKGIQKTMSLVNSMDFGKKDEESYEKL